MNLIQKKNLTIFNLAKYGHSSRTLRRIFFLCQDCIIDENKIIEILGKNDKSASICEDFWKISKNEYSIYCLLPYGINIFIIDKISKSFSSLNEIAVNLDQFKLLPLHREIISKIENVIDDLNIKPHKELKKIILSLISEYESIQNFKLKEIILNNYKNIKTIEYDYAIDGLIKAKKIRLTADGLKKYRIFLDDFFIKSTDNRDAIAYKRIKGNTLEKVASKYGISRERVRQIINKQIETYPIFHNEDKYLTIMKEYNLSEKDAQLLGLVDTNLFNYINLKYSFKQSDKNVIDYLEDNNLYDTKRANDILNYYNYAYINKKIYSVKFTILLKIYLSEFKIHSFNLRDIKEDFNNFLRDKKIENESIYISDIDDIKKKNRQLQNLDDLFLNVKGDNFIFFEKENISYEFLDATFNYLNEFDGYGSVGYFFNKETDLCLKNNINNENELFVVLKYLYLDKFSDSIEFVRNPTILKKGVDKNIYLESLLLDIKLPCTVNDYLDYVYKTTGLKQNTVLANFSNRLSRYKNTKGELSLEEDVTEKEYEYLITLLSDIEIIGLDYIHEKLKIKFGERLNLIINNNTLRKIGFVKTDTCIYSMEYSSRLDAVKKALEKADFIIEKNDLLKISNLDYFYYRFYDFIDYGYLIRIGKTKYLNLLRREQFEMYNRFKSQLVELCQDDEIYVLDDFLDSKDFLNLLEKNEEIKDLLYSFDSKEIIKFMIMTIRELHYVEKNDNLIFSKISLSLKTIVEKIMKENGILSKLDLREILYNQYHIDDQITNSELEDMGFYCPHSSEKVYLNEEYFEQEMEVILNGNS